MDPVLFISQTENKNLKEQSWYLDLPGVKPEKGEGFSFLFENAGIYPVALKAVNEWGCADTLIKVVQVEEDVLFFMPNTFTPNDDGRNDLFRPVTRGVKNLGLKIFNRWGQLLYETTDPSAGWDGSYKGSACQEGVYVWKAAITTKSGTEREYSGHVTVVR
jgi:gliding motility-associated-like protein